MVNKKPTDTVHGEKQNTEKDETSAHLRHLDCKLPPVHIDTPKRRKRRQLTNTNTNHACEQGSCRHRPMVEKINTLSTTENGSEKKANMPYTGSKLSSSASPLAANVDTVCAAGSSCPPPEGATPHPTFASFTTVTSEPATASSLSARNTSSKWAASRHLPLP